MRRPHSTPALSGAVPPLRAALRLLWVLAAGLLLLLSPLLRPVSAQEPTGEPSEEVRDEVENVLPEEGGEAVAGTPPLPAGEAVPRDRAPVVAAVEVRSETTLTVSARAELQ